MTHGGDFDTKEGKMKVLTVSVVFYPLKNSQLGVLGEERRT